MTAYVPTRPASMRHPRGQPHAQAVAGDVPLTILQRLALALVWLAVASGAVVFSEPAPVDVLTMGLIIGLPMVGLVVVPAALWIVGAGLALCGACALIASSFAPDLGKSTIHSVVSLYLYAAFFVFAAFVAKRPHQHTRLILEAWLWAAFVAAVAGVVGYFNLVPGAFELFTRFGRASGTFKDSNVYGPFLVPALLYALHKVLNEPLRRTLVPALILLFLSFALLLSFSRGAWFNAVVAVAIYLYGSLVFAPSNRQRLKLVGLGTLAIAAAVVVLAMAARSDAISDLLSSRAALTQSYDVGPDGRFGGQQKAKTLILDNPFGLGAQVFAPHYHHEEPHNVYLSVFINAGWAGGLVYIAIVWLTVLWGLRHAMHRSPTQPMYLIAFGAFTANVLEGFIIDLDHWRHFYLLMAIVWGLMLADRQSVTVPGSAPRRQARPMRPAMAGAQA
jgi:O-antigen ligase